MISNISLSVANKLTQYRKLAEFLANETGEYTDDQVLVFIDAANKRLRIPMYLDNRFCSKALTEIFLGIEADIDETVYAKHCYTHLQMKEIRLALMANIEEDDIERIANPMLTPRQMGILRECAKKGLDTSLIASDLYCEEQTEELYRGYLEGAGIKFYNHHKIPVSVMRILRKCTNYALGVEVMNLYERGFSESKIEALWSATQHSKISTEILNKVPYNFPEKHYDRLINLIVEGYDMSIFNGIDEQYLQILFDLFTKMDDIKLLINKLIIEGRYDIFQFNAIAEAYCNKSVELEDITSMCDNSVPWYAIKAVTVLMRDNKTIPSSILGVKHFDEVAEIMSDYDNFL